MAYILAKNDIHHAYWRNTSKPVITSIALGVEADGHKFINSFDDNAATSFKIKDANQATFRVVFDSEITMNGFAVYGHNFSESQGLKIEYYSAADADYSDFEDTGSLYNGTYTAGKFYRAFGAYIDQDVAVKGLKITTVGWDTNTFMSNFAIGRWVDGVNLTAPFTPPIYEPQMSEIKRNNKGNPLLTDTRKVPQKFSINMSKLIESDIFGATSFTDSIMGFSATHSFAEYFGYYLPRFPFFLMYDDGTAASTDADKIARRNRMWYCVIDKQSKQPSYNTPTTLNWRIPVVGYIS